MGSDEAGAASAIRGLGSEPCGARCVCDDCGLPSRAPPMARMAALRRLNPGRARCECRGVLGPHRTAREPITSVATGRCETRVVVDDFNRSLRHRHETHGLLARHRRAAALHLAAPFVAARRCTPTGLKLPIGCTTPGDWDGAESRRHMLHTSKERRAHAKRQGALERQIKGAARAHDRQGRGTARGRGRRRALK